MSRSIDDASPADSRWAWVRQRWFSTLFLTDMWERFSFYGMMAILYLYATASLGSGGLGFAAATGAALVGAYMSAVFLCAVPGGWLGDRVLGARKATLSGAILIALGHCCLAVPATATFYLGIALLAAGTGLLKPNIGVLLGASYPRDATAQREAGFSIFYMSIQIPALLAPLVVGFLGEQVNWHLGFGAAAVGMAIGVAQYVRGARHLGEVGLVPSDRPPDLVLRKYVVRSVAAVAVVGLAFAADAFAGTFTIQHALIFLALVALVTPIPYFRGILRHPELSAAGRRRIRTYIFVFLISMLFWVLFTQSRSVLSEFALESTDRSLWGLTIPASWFQSLHPLFVLAGAPIFAWLWMRIGDRADLRSKLTVGLCLAGISYLIMATAAALAGTSTVSPLWLVAVYLLQSCGELAFGPVTMSVTIESAPKELASQMMGLWWLAAAVGAALGGQLARFVSGAQTPLGFLILGAIPILAGAVLLAFGQRMSWILTPRHDSEEREVRS